MQTEEQKKATLEEIVGSVNSILVIIDKYEANRPGSNAVMKLEEAVMWAQVMIYNVALKTEIPNTDTENKENNNVVDPAATQAQ